MDKSEIESLVRDKRDSFVQIVKAKHPEFYSYINTEISGRTVSEKIYKWLYNKSGVCERCGKGTKFHSISVGFSKYCSKKCSNSATASNRGKSQMVNKDTSPFWIKKKCLRCNTEFLSLISRGQLFCSNRCSVLFSSKSIERLTAIQNTKLKRYNDPHYTNKEKQKRTMLETYGVKNIFESNDVKDKIKRQRVESYMERLKSSDRLKWLVVPLFNENQYITGHRQNFYKFQCCLCKNIFEDHIDDGRIPRCRKCFPVDSKSIWETDVSDFIRSICKDPVVLNDRRTIYPQELDIVIPNKNIAIECDGIFWHSELSGKKTSGYHSNKTLRSFKQGIRLIHIFEDEWVYRKGIVKSRLLSMLSEQIGGRISARLCVVKELSNSEASRFLDDNHIQGAINATVCLGLFYADVLVSVMTFSKNRISTGSTHIEGEYELLRFCSKINTVVQGGVSKLFSHFIKKYNPVKITSFSDLRWGGGNIYKKLGFVHVSKTSPNYWYFKKGEFSRHHRFGFRKQVLKDKLSNFDSSLTEWENMQLNGYDRIWDCGSNKYVWTKYL